MQTDANRRLAEGGLAGGGFSDLMENRSFWGSGRPQAAQKPFKKVGGFAPYLLKGFWAARGCPETQNDRFSIKSLNPPLLDPPFGAPNQGYVTSRGWALFVFILGGTPGPVQL